MRSRDRTIMALQEHIYHACSLEKAKPRIDSSTPKCFGVHRGKSVYQEKSQRLQIGQENTRLSQNIQNQMKRRSLVARKHLSLIHI